MVVAGAYWIRDKAENESDSRLWEFRDACACLAAHAGI